MSERFGEFVEVRRHGFVAELVLDRPKAMNAVSSAMAVSVGRPAPLSRLMLVLGLLLFLLLPLVLFAWGPTSRSGTPFPMPSSFGSGL